MYEYRNAKLREFAQKHASQRLNVRIGYPHTLCEYFASTGFLGQMGLILISTRGTKKRPKGGCTPSGLRNRDETAADIWY